MKILRIVLLIFLVCFGLSLAYFLSKKSTPEDLLHVLRGHKNIVTSLAFSLDGEYIASADGAGVIKVWNTASYKLVMQIELQKSQFEYQRIVSEILFLPDNKTLVSSDFRGNLIFWNIKTHAIEWQYKTDSILMMSMSNSGIIAITTFLRRENAPEKNQLIFIDYQKKSIIKKWELGGISNRPKTIGLSHDGKRIAYVNMDDVFLLKNISDGQTIWKIKKPTYSTFLPRNGIEFSPDDKRIATTYRDMDASVQILRSSSGDTVAEVDLTDKITGVGKSVSYTMGGKKLLILTNHNEVLLIDKMGSVVKMY